MPETGTSTPKETKRKLETVKTSTSKDYPSGDNPDYRLSTESAYDAQFDNGQGNSKSHNAGRARRIAIVLVVLLIGGGVWWAVDSGWMAAWGQTHGSLIASGTLEADEILISSEVSGRILQLVQEGQSVTAGDIVTSLDDSLLQVQIRQATTAQLQQLEVTADRYQLHSPISGVITRVPMHVGEVLTPGQTAAAVANLDQLKLTAYVLERDLGRVQVGQTVAVTADPFPGKVFSGVVTSTNPRAEFTPRNIQTQEDRLNLVFGVQILVDNPSRELKPGMPADVTFANTSPNS